MTAHDPVLQERCGDVAVLRLNDGARLNPLTAPLLDALHRALLATAADTGVRAVVLGAVGKGFSSGADLADLTRRGDSLGPGETLGGHVADLLAQHAEPVLRLLQDFPVPVVCAVNGAAAGGGVGLALSGDVVIAARSAYFYLPFLPKLGICPDMGSSWRLTRILGEPRALGMALLGERLGAAQAVEWGLIWACVDDERLDEHALQIAQRLAALPAHAIGEARRLLALAARQDLPAQRAYERERQRELVDGPSFAQGVSAFLARREPVFPGREAHPSIASELP